MDVLCRAGEYNCRMETKWRTTSSGETVYEVYVPYAARLLIGGMLSIFAIFFGYYLVTGLVEYIRVATASEWLTALPGFLVVLLLFLVFAVPTWYLLTVRQFVVIDPSAGFLSEVSDMRIYRRLKRYPLSQIRKVTISHKRLRTRGHSSHTYAVAVVLKDDKQITAGYEDQIDDAKELARLVEESLRGSGVSLEE